MKLNISIVCTGQFTEDFQMEPSRFESLLAYARGEEEEPAPPRVQEEPPIQEPEREEEEAQGYLKNGRVRRSPVRVTERHAKKIASLISQGFSNAEVVKIMSHPVNDGHVGSIRRGEAWLHQSGFTPRAQRAKDDINNPRYFNRNSDGTMTQEGLKCLRDARDYMQALRDQKADLLRRVRISGGKKS